MENQTLHQADNCMTESVAFWIVGWRNSSAVLRYGELNMDRRFAATSMRTECLGI